MFDGSGDIWKSAANDKDLVGEDDIATTYSADPSILSFARYICQDPGPAREAVDANYDDIYNTQIVRLPKDDLCQLTRNMLIFAKSVLHECLVNDKPEALHIYLYLYKYYIEYTKRDTEHPEPRFRVFKNAVRLIAAYYSCRNATSRQQIKDRLLDGIFVESLYIGTHSRGISPRVAL